MRGESESSSIEAAIKSGVRAVSGNGAASHLLTVTDRADSRTEGWFAKVAQPLLVNVDAGFALNLLTHVHERSCYRYASGEREPHGWFIRQLLHSNQGRTWLNALMEGSDAPWWREHQRAEQLHATLKHLLRE